MTSDNLIHPVLALRATGLFGFAALLTQAAVVLATDAVEFRIQDPTCNPPTLSCPKDVELGCNPVGLPEPDFSAVAVSGGCAPVTVTHSDHVFSNRCDNTVIRSYVAIDSEGHTAECQQVITYRVSGCLEGGPCGPCDGGVTSLTLRYGGGQEAQVVVYDDNRTYFSGSLAPGQEFTIDGTRSDGKFEKNELSITVNGVLDTQLHVSCSQPIGVGSVFGSFTVIAGTSRDGGAFCEDPCAPCDGGVTRLTLRYDGEASAHVMVFDDVMTYFSEEVVAGQEFPISGTRSDGKFEKNELSITVNGILDAELHVSCSQPIGVGSVFGSFRVTDGASRDGGPFCQPPRDPCEEPPFTVISPPNEDLGCNPTAIPAPNPTLVGVVDGVPPYDVTHVGDELIQEGCLYTLLRTYRATDSTGQGAHCTQLITYRLDTTAPVMSSDPEDFLGECERSFPCNECDGGVTSLTLRHDGISTAHVVVFAGSRTYFTGDVAPGAEFTVGDPASGTRVGDLDITVNGVLNTEIHTSCSQPIGIDRVFGSFTVTDGYSKNGGRFCPISDCGECDGGVTSLTLRYDGDTAVTIRVSDDAGDYYHALVQPGQEFSIFGTRSDGKFEKNDLRVTVNGALNTEIHVSCSQPIGIGSVFGDFTVLDGASRSGGRFCPASACAECDGGVTSLALRYRGSAAAQIRVFDTSDIYFNELVQPGQIFSISGTRSGGKFQQNDVSFTVNGVLNTEIHMSCSKPIAVGMDYGSFTIVDGASRDGGTLCPIPGLDGVPPPPFILAYDPCGGLAPVTYTEEILEDSSCALVLYRTWTATDDCGNSTTVDQLVVLGDIQPPELAGVPNDLTVACLADVPSPPAVTAKDVCDGVVDVDLSVTTEGACPAVMTRTWTATDSCLHTATETQVITIDDQAAPLLIGVPGDVDLGCNADWPMPTDVTGMDNCGGDVPVELDSVRTQDGCTQTMVRTWSTTDACGNRAAASQTLTRKMDVEPPVLAAPDAITLEGDADCRITVPVIEFTVSDNCGGSGVTVVQTPPKGSVLTGPGSFTVTLTATDECGNSATDTAAIPVVCDAELGDFVWLDENANGIQDLGEEGIGGVPVRLLDTAGNELGTTTTDRNGRYEFTGLVPGGFQVEFGIPDDFEASPRTMGTDPTVDSDGDPLTGLSPVITVEPNQSDLTIDQGLYEPAVIGDYVWMDTNGDGQQGDPRVEEPIAGVPVTLLDEDGNIVATTTTDVTGYYQFTVPPGTYTVAFEAPPGFEFAQQDLGNDASDSDADVMGLTGPVTVGSGERILTLDAGLICGLTIKCPGDVSLECGPDLDTSPAVTGQPVADGCCEIVSMQSSDEITEGCGASYTITRTWTVLDRCKQVVTCVQRITVKDTTPPMLTAQAGFTRQGDAQCQMEVPVLTFEVDDNCDPDVDVTQMPPAGTILTGPATFTVTLTATDSCGNSAADTADITVVCEAGLGDFVWLDQDADGIQDPDEMGVKGVLVRLLDDLGATIATTTTDEDGLYRFEGLEPGDYSVQFDPPAGFVVSSARPGADPALDSNPDASGLTPILRLRPNEFNPTIDMGMYAHVCLGDLVWEDLNGDGIQDLPEEPGLEGITVELRTCDANEVIASTNTLTDGSYEFCDVRPGEYYLVFAAPEDFEFTRADQAGDDCRDSDADDMGQTACRLLESGGSDTCGDAGLFQPVRIGDYVWIDANGDGLQGDSVDEPPAAGVTVNLLDKDGLVVATTPTEADGSYLFVTEPGTYVVEFAPSVGFAFTRLGDGTDPAGDSDADPITGATASVTLMSGEEDRTLDAGLICELEIMCPVDRLVECAPVLDLSPAALGDDPIADGCCTVVDVVYEDLEETLCGNTRTILREWTVVDACEQTISCTQRIDVVDTTAPALMGVPENIKVECNAMPEPPIVTAMDACDPNPMITGPVDFAFPGPCPNGYVLERVWTATDACGNSHSATQMVTVVDTTPPVIEGIEDQVFTLECGEPGPQLPQVTAMDACDGVVGVESHIEEFFEACDSLTVITWTAVDSCGNAAAVIWEIAKRDAQPPRLTPPDDQTLLGDENCVVEVPLLDVQAVDHCQTAPLVSQYPPAGDLFQGPGALTVTVTAGDGCGNQTVEAVTITVECLAALGDRVWSDTNANGIQESGEEGVPDVLVELLDAAGLSASSTTTDPDGFYRFDNLEPGDYAVVFTPPGGFQISPPKQGTDQTRDSDPNPLTGQTEPVTLAAGDENLGVDAGIFMTGSIDLVKTVDRLFIVRPDDSVTYTFAVTNPAGAAITDVELIDDRCGPVEFTGGDLNRNEMLEAGEVWSFTCAQTYTWDFPRNFTNTAIVTGFDLTGRPVSAVDSAKVVALGIDVEKRAMPDVACVGDDVTITLITRLLNGVPGVELRDVDVSDPLCGPLSVVGGDTNNDGILQFGEVWTNTCTFVVTQTTTNFASDSAVAWFDDGETEYEIGPLYGEDSMIVPVIEPAFEVAIEAGTLSVPIGSNVSYATEITNLGEEPLKNIAVAHSAAAECHQSVPGELLAGDSLTLTCTVENVTQDFVDEITVTAEGGPGCRAVAEGLVRVTVFLPDPTIGDYVWFDANGDGLQGDPMDESGVAGVIVQLLNDRGTMVDTSATDEDGFYQFPVPPGDYQVEFILPEGYEFTTPDQGNEPFDSDADPATGTTPLTTVVPGMNDLTWDAGLVRLPFGAAIVVPDVDCVCPGSMVNLEITVVNTGKVALVDLVLTSQAVPACDTTLARLEPGASTVFSCQTTVQNDLLSAVVLAAVTPLGDPVSAEAEIRVNVDTEAPAILSCPADITVECGEEIPPPDKTQVVALDDCSEEPTIDSTDTFLLQTCPAVLERTYRISDGCGNTTSCIQRILIEDTQPPVLAAVPDAVTVECDAIPDPPGVTATDLCEGGVDVVFREVSDGRTCPETITRTWTAADSCGNEVSATQRIVVGDILPPTINAPPQLPPILSEGLPDDPETCIDFVPDLIGRELVTANDHCSEKIALSQIPTPGTLFTNAVVMLITAEDQCGNESSVNLVQTCTPPEITCVSVIVRIFRDEDKNGVYVAATDQGLANVSVRLMDESGMPAGDPEVTDGDGLAEFARPPAGTYVVMVDESTVPEDLGLGSPFLNPSAPFTYDPFDEDTCPGDLAIGYRDLCDVCGVVWLDTDADGLPDEDIASNGLNNVTVSLVPAGGQSAIATAVTAVGACARLSSEAPLNGVYVFENIPDGFYQIIVDQRTVPEDLRDRPTTSVAFELICDPRGPTAPEDPDFGFVEEPTAIGLVSFSATEVLGGVLLEWETGVEVNNLGFNIYRADSEDGEQIRINSRLILPSGSSAGGKYHLVDSTAEAGGMYFYWLGDMDTSFSESLHGPVVVNPVQVLAATEVEAGGIYRLDGAALAAAEIGADASEITVLVDGREVCAHVSAIRGRLNHEDYVLFYVPAGGARIGVAQRSAARRMAEFDARPRYGDGEVASRIVGPDGWVRSRMRRGVIRQLLAGFRSPNVVALDVTDPIAPLLLHGYAVLEVDGEYGMYLTLPDDEDRECIVVEEDAVLELPELHVNP